MSDYKDEIRKLFESLKAQWQAEFDFPLNEELVLSVLQEEITKRQKEFVSQRLFHMKPTKKLDEARKFYLDSQNENRPRGGSPSKYPSPKSKPN